MWSQGCVLREGAWKAESAGGGGWGCFSGIQIGAPGRGLRIVETVASTRTRVANIAYGDQALFVWRDTLDCVGGFKEWPLLEDYELVLRLKRRVGNPAVLPQRVHVSARRWQALGALRVTVLNQAVIAAYHLGVPPESLARFYYNKNPRGLWGWIATGHLRW